VDAAICDVPSDNHNASIPNITAIPNPATNFKAINSVHFLFPNFEYLQLELVSDFN